MRRELLSGQCSPDKRKPIMHPNKAGERETDATPARFFALPSSYKAGCLTF